MNKKCQADGCLKFVRQVFRLGEELFYTCNEHYGVLVDRYNEIQHRVANMNEEQMIARLEELNRKEERKLN